MSEKRFVTIEYFIKEMMGYKSKTSYYNHIHDKGWPQPVYPGGGQPLLVYDECVAYQNQLLKQRTPPGGEEIEKPKKKEPPPRRRHAGRPAKAHPAA